MEKDNEFFERLVVELLLKMGYGSAFEASSMVVGKTCEDGIKGVIRDDKLGFSNIYIRARHCAINTSIGRPEIQDFVGALAGQCAQKGLFITTAKFSKEATEYIQKQSATKVVLVDGDTLSKLMIEYDVGVSTETTYVIRKIDTDFFDGDII